MAGGGLLQQVDAPDQRGFAGAAHAHDAEDVPGLDGEAHILQGVKLTLAGGEGFGQVLDRKSTRLNSSHITRSRMPSSA